MNNGNYGETKQGNNGKVTFKVEQEAGVFSRPAGIPFCEPKTEPDYYVNKRTGEHIPQSYEDLKTVQQTKGREAITHEIELFDKAYRDLREKWYAINPLVKAIYRRICPTVSYLEADVCKTEPFDPIGILKEVIPYWGLMYHGDTGEFKQTKFTEKDVANCTDIGDLYSLLLR